jgi:hypothetical protein
MRKSMEETIENIWPNIQEKNRQGNYTDSKIYQRWIPKYNRSTTGNRRYFNTSYALTVPAVNTFPRGK